MQRLALRRCSQPSRQRVLWKGKPKADFRAEAHASLARSLAHSPRRTLHPLL
jgi:hypothetical protein